VLQVQWLHVSVTLATIIRPNFTGRAPSMCLQLCELYINCCVGRKYIYILILLTHNGMAFDKVYSKSSTYHLPI